MRIVLRCLRCYSLNKVLLYCANISFKYHMDGQKVSEIALLWDTTVYKQAMNCLSLQYKLYNRLMVVCLNSSVMCVLICLFPRMTHSREVRNMNNFIVK